MWCTGMGQHVHGCECRYKEHTIKALIEHHVLWIHSIEVTLTAGHFCFCFCWLLGLFAVPPRCSLSKLF